MQYCPNCRVRIRGRKARCPLCQRELTELERNGPEMPAEEEFDPFVRLPGRRVSFLMLVRIVTFVCVSLEILLGAAEILSGGNRGWIIAVMLGVLLGWIDFRIAVYYHSNLLRMLTTQGYLIMALCLAIAHWTGGSWAISWVVPGMFLLLIAVTFTAAAAQRMELHEFILYPAFDVLMSLLQIVPIVLGKNPLIGPAVLCIAGMLILVSSLIIFRGRMLQEAALKYLHL